jgi:hypothetical protein
MSRLVVYRNKLRTAGADVVWSEEGSAGRLPEPSHDGVTQVSSARRWYIESTRVMCLEASVVKGSEQFPPYV